MFELNGMKKIFTSIVAASIISIVIQTDVNAQSGAESINETMIVAEDIRINAFPNPAVDYVEFHATGSGMIMDVQLFDMIGNNVFTEDLINQPKYVLERRTLKDGMYIYSVKDANGKAYTGRITLK